MKKTLILLLVIIVVFSGCSSADKSSDMTTAVVETEDRSSSEVQVQSADTLPPATPIPTNEPTPVPTPEPTATPEPTPSYVDITITIDNWQDYFELYQHEVWEKNAFGENTGFVIYTAMKIKDELIPRVGNANDDPVNIIDVKIVFTSDDYLVNVNYDTQTYTKASNEVIRHRDNFESVNSFYVSKYSYDCNFFCTSYHEGISYQTISYYTDLRVDKIQGTLRLTAE